MAQALTLRGACYTSIRNVSYHVTHSTSTPPLEFNNLLNRLSVLSTRRHVEEALSFFYSVPPQFQSCHIYSSLFQACTRHGFIEQGLYLHQHMLANRRFHSPNVVTTNHLINMYAKFGYMDQARKLFDEMCDRNVVSWTALVSGYAQEGSCGDAFRLFLDMLAHCRPNEFAVSSLLSSCDYDHGKQVHGFALKIALDVSFYVANALISMYGRNGRGGDEACVVFETMKVRNLISWNSMLSAFHCCKLVMHAIDVFIRMHRDGIRFDHATLLIVFSLLCESLDLKSGLNFCLQLHCISIKTRFVLETRVATAVVKAYSDLGQVSDCYRVFMEMGCYRDIITWTTIITALADYDPEKALFLFRQLQREGLSPDWYTFSIVLKACAGFVTARHASAVHSQVTKVGFGVDTVLNNALIHAYSRCGSIDFSKQVFEEMGYRDLVSWNSMLKAYALQGKARETLLLYSEMNIDPDSATFVALLLACSHAGLVNEGLEIFESMFEKHRIVPQLDHYACVVDLLGRAGRINEANFFINRMPMEPDSVVWSSLLGSCRKHGETELAKLAADKLKELEPENSLSFVQMSNIYCSGGRFNEAGVTRKEMKGLQVIKEPGLSWVELGKEVHEFASGGRLHPQRESICLELDKLIARLKEIGYVPETTLAMHDTEEEHKEEELLYHSEKLALMSAIMQEKSTGHGRNIIRIMKNIRICVDCHNFMKLASEFLHKEIVVRDSNRFHHFKHRLCSCSDYW